MAMELFRLVYLGGIRKVRSFVQNSHFSWETKSGGPKPTRKLWVDHAADDKP